MSLKLQAAEQAIYKLSLLESDIYNISVNDYCVYLQGEKNEGLMKRIERDNEGVVFQSNKDGFFFADDSIFIEYPSSKRPHSVERKTYRVRIYFH